MYKSTNRHDESTVGSFDFERALRLADLRIPAGQDFVDRHGRHEMLPQLPLPDAGRQRFDPRNEVGNRRRVQNVGTLDGHGADCWVSASASWRASSSSLKRRISRISAMRMSLSSFD